MDEKVRNILFAGGEVMIAVFTALNLGIGIWNNAPKYDWKISALLGFVAFFLLVVWHISIQNSELKSTTPNIQIDGNPYPHDARIKNGAIIHISNVPFSNNPKFLTPYNSVNVVLANIEYIDEQGKVLFKLKPGRWTDTKFPCDLSDREHHAIQHIDFPNTGVIRWLELLVKYPEDEFCYGFNNASIRINKFWLNLDFIIAAKRFFIRVELRGNYLKKKIGLLRL